MKHFRSLIGLLILATGAVQAQTDCLTVAGQIATVGGLPVCLSTVPTAVAPTFSPAAGTYTSAQTVALSCVTPSSTLYYTTDGSSPTTASSVYASPLSVGTTETINAICTATGYLNSSVGSALYTISLNSPSPNGTTIAPAASIKDQNLNVWTVSGGVISSTQPGYNGFSQNVELVLYYGNAIYQENNLYNWYQWTGTTYTQVAGDPRTTSFTAPNAPLSVSATAGNASAQVAYSPPWDTGGGTITYTATSSPGGKTGTGTSPIVVTGLTNGTSYTFTVTATNSKGTSPASVASNSVTPTATTTFGITVSGHNILNGSGTPVQLRGVNVSGPEGTADNGPNDIWRGQAPNFSAMKNNWGINIIRIPLAEANWLGLCSTTLAQGMTGANYQAGVASAVSSANALGIYVILDLHIVAVPNICPNGQNPMADSQYSPTFWGQVANAYKNNPAVLFELFNEPQGNCPPQAVDFNNYVNSKLYESTDTNTQTLLNSIRATGATNVVLVDTLNYASTFGYETNPICGGGSTSYGFILPTDSLHQEVAVQHYYHGSTFETGANHVLNQNIPIIVTEYGEPGGGDSDETALYGWADPHGRAAVALGDSSFPGVSYVAWTWNFGYGSYSLISNSSGTNAGSTYSQEVQSHYLCRAAGTC